jgi:hypothetical protein
MQQQELQIARAELAAGPEIIPAAAAMAPVPAEKAAVAMSAAAAAMPADAVAPAPMSFMFFVKMHICFFRLFRLTYRKIYI